MATITKWTPFGVALNLTATGSTVTRKSATQYTVKINVSWETYYEGAQTKYGMTASSGGSTATLKAFSNTAASSGSGTLTGTYSISGNGSATKTVTVTFRNFNDDNGDSATKTVSFNVSVPAWTSYEVTYDANGGTGAPSSQTKWKDQTLTLSSVTPARTGHTFQGWGVASNDTTVNYNPGGSYTSNASITLYAIWKANTYTITYNANGGTGAPSNQTKTYGKTLVLSNAIPTRANYTFKGWGNSATTSIVSFAPGSNYTLNAAATLYAVWELGYSKPKITDYSVIRCNSLGLEQDNGENALVRFKWTTTNPVSSVVITCESASASTITKTITASGNSGSVTYIIGTNVLSPDITYTIRATVTDSGGSTYASTSIPGLILPFDAKVGGTGVAFGKTAELDGYADIAFITRHRNNVIFDNNFTISGTTPSGKIKEALNIVNSTQGDGIDGNIVLGWGNYDGKSGNTNVYGNDVLIGVSNITTPGTFRPYRRKGDSVTFSIRTAGYVTNDGKDVSFVVPFAVPIIGSPTVTVTSTTGFTLRQSGKYTHGSTSGETVTPDSYSAIVAQWCGIYITAKFTNVTNVINNDSIGIVWGGTITFS